MGFADDLLTILTDYSGGYKLMRKRMYGIHEFCADSTYQTKLQKIKDQTIRTTLYRLKKSGLVENKSRIWKITKKGAAFLDKRLRLKLLHFQPISKSKKKDIIIIFDIPENERKKRNWLRNELKSLGFMLIQKSVWLGPSPLPKEFIKYLNKIDIVPHLRFFRVNEDDLI